MFLKLLQKVLAKHAGGMQKDGETSEPPTPAGGGAEELGAGKGVLAGRCSRLLLPVELRPSRSIPGGFNTFHLLGCAAQNRSEPRRFFTF